MKALGDKGWAKVLAVILFVICLYACLGSAVGIVYLANGGAYDQRTQGDTVTQSVLKGMLHQENRKVANLYQSMLYQQDATSATDLTTAYQQYYAQGNYFFTLSDDQSNSTQSSNQGTALVTVTDTYQMELPTSSGAAYQSWTRSFTTEKERDETLEKMQSAYQVTRAEMNTQLGADGESMIYTLSITYQETEQRTVTVTGSVQSGLAAEDMFKLAAVWTDRLDSLRYGLIVLCVAGGVGTILCLIFLLRAAGHKEGVEGIALNWMDKIPFDLYIILVLIPLGCTMGLGVYPQPGSMIFWVLLGVVATVWVLLGLSLLCTFAVRVKAKCLWKNTLLRRLCTLCKKNGGGLGRKLAALFHKLPLFWKTGAVFLLCCFLEGLCILAIAGGALGGAFFWFLFKAAQAALVIWLVLSMRTLQEGGRELAKGNLDYEIPLIHLRWDLREHGENLNHIRDGIQGAVEERMKSEHLKTELITNVSHDLKTPLTSLINYVDLLKKENLSNEKAEEYLRVLDRQSARLKKLTEDLVEASKASTGNLPVNLEAADGNVLLSQSAGEYEEKLAAKGLQLVLQPAPETARILADGRLLWRVFDNLLSNIVKYAQPGTRVYLTSQVREEQVQFTFRNISATPLNLTSQELLERFTRGDASRNTEGSGLGLSIAQSLVALQKGSFRLTIDGDLFKAEITLPRLP